MSHNVDAQQSSSHKLILRLWISLSCLQKSHFHWRSLLQSGVNRTADDAIEHAHYKHGKGEVPGVTHGNEHHIVGIFQVPLGAAWRVQHKTNLPEPGALNHRERAPQQLQNDVASVKDLQEGNKSLSKDRVQKEQMHVDIQHAPAMEVVKKKKSFIKESNSQH